jgi:voltage-gated potassium channel
MELHSRLKNYVPYMVAAVVMLNGFFTLATGLSRFFQLDIYFAKELEQVGDLIDVTPDLQMGGFVSILLGGLFIALGKGLVERRRSSWQKSIVVLALQLLNALIQGLPLRSTGLSILLLAALIVLRRDFNYAPPKRQLGYGELVAGLSVFFALVYGVTGSYLMRSEFSGIESWADAVYFTFVTFSTVGYGDLLPQTTNARIFTMSMILIGLSAFATAVTVVLGPLLEERMKGVFSVMSKFQKTVDHVVVCGFTNVSESIFDELRERSIPFIIIEENESLVMHLKGLGYDVLHGDPTNKVALEQANLPRAAAVIAATDSDATNTLITLTARELRDQSEAHTFRIIARVEDEENIAKVKHVGADEVISPSTIGGRMMAEKAI